MIGNQIQDFIKLCDFASVSAGGKVLFATDDFFAISENLIADSEPMFIADKYTEFGKWMDGWETRRKRKPGHDWCIIKLAINCVIRGLLVDTAFFTGNNAPKFSIQAAVLTPEEIDTAVVPTQPDSRIRDSYHDGNRTDYECPQLPKPNAHTSDLTNLQEELIPVRNGTMGSASSDKELELISRLHSEKWKEIVPRTTLQPGYEDTRRNYVKVMSEEAWTHIRLNIYPDGGIARLRVYGEARPQVPPPDQLVDLLSLLNGGVCEGYSNAHYGHPKNLIKPFKGTGMADGWETARRTDRPEVIKCSPDGTLKYTGEEWAVFRLGFPGNIKRITVDTTHFKGNYPYTVKVEGLNLEGDWCPEAKYEWENILKPSKLSANNEQWFESNSDIITHIRLTIAPDGGISRVRALGYVYTGI